MRPKSPYPLLHIFIIKLSSSLHGQLWHCGEHDPQVVVQIQSNHACSRLRLCELVVWRLSYYLSSRDRNVYFWVNSSPHFYEEIEKNLLLVTFWAAPYFLVVWSSRQPSTGGERVLKAVGTLHCNRTVLHRLFNGHFAVALTIESVVAPRISDLNTPDNVFWGLDKRRGVKTAIRH